MNEVTSSLSHSKIEVDSACVLVLVEVISANLKKFIIVLFTNPPNSDNLIVELIKESLEQISKTYPEQTILISLTFNMLEKYIF